MSSSSALSERPALTSRSSSFSSRSASRRIRRVTPSLNSCRRASLVETTMARSRSRSQAITRALPMLGATLRCCRSSQSSKGDRWTSSRCRTCAGLRLPAPAAPAQPRGVRASGPLRRGADRRRRVRIRVDECGHPVHLADEDPGVPRRRTAGGLDADCRRGPHRWRSAFGRDRRRTRSVRCCARACPGARGVDPAADERLAGMSWDATWSAMERLIRGSAERADCAASRWWASNLP